MIFIAWLILSFAVASLGSSRKIGYWGLLLLSLLLSPLIGLIIGLVSEKLKTGDDYEKELLQVHSLFDKGLITPEQFDARKKDIQGKMGVIKTDIDHQKELAAEGDKMTNFWFYASIGVVILVVLMLLFGL